ncbi:MAG TPA: hypothetical protein VKT78_00375 [Fimbriimonadaceae bacterium]|nr:hypothetical protein [Fimbriimonadaceae bacterium]
MALKVPSLPIPAHTSTSPENHYAVVLWALPGGTTFPAAPCTDSTSNGWIEFGYISQWGGSGTGTCSGRGQTYQGLYYSADGGRTCTPISKVTAHAGSQHTLELRYNSGAFHLYVDGQDAIGKGMDLGSSQLAGGILGLEAGRLACDALGPIGLPTAEYNDGTKWQSWSNVQSCHQPATCSANQGSANTVSCAPDLFDGGDVSSLDFTSYPGGSAVANNMTFTTTGSDKNPPYGHSLRLGLIRGAPSWLQSITQEPYQPACSRLRLKHLSSYSAACPGKGYSPVTVSVNGQAVAKNFSPASHDYTTDSWDLAKKLNLGPNVIRIEAGLTCTHYWLQRLDVAIAR